MKKLFLLIFAIIATVSSAPAGKNSLFDIVKKDPRTKDLQKRRLINECRIGSEISKSICFALYDVSLTFNSRNSSFNLVNATFELDTFCQSLHQLLPDSPVNNDSLSSFKEVKWLKDVDEEQCEAKCVYEDPNSYEKSLVAVCRFLFNQYTFLNGDSQKQPQQDVKSEEKKEVGETTEDKTLETSPEQTKAVPIPAADKQNNTETSPKVTVDETSPKVAVNGTSNKTAETNVNVESSVAQTTSVLSGEKKLENVAEVEKKPIAQTSPATTASKVTQKPAEQPSKVVDDKEKIDDQLQPNTGDQSLDEDDDDDSGNKFPFDEADPSVTPEDYNDPGDDEEIIDGAQRNNNAVPVKPQEYENDSQKLVNNDQLTMIKQVPFEESPESNFFAYLCSVMFLCVFLYILHQNRQKLLALCLEGRRGSRRSSRSRGGSKAAYSKLDCNLEEAITSNKSMSGKSMDIIY